MRPEDADTEWANEALARRVSTYRIVSRAYFHLPIVVVLLTTEGFGVLWIAAALAVYCLAAAFGDRLIAPFRRRLTLLGSLVVGELVKVAGLLIFVLPLTTWSILLAQVLAGLGFSMTAGTDAALASMLRTGERYRSQESRVQMGMFLISFVAGVLGALAFAFWPRLPFILSALGCLVASAVLYGRGPLLELPPSAATAVPAAAAGERIPGTVRFFAAYYSVSRAVLLAVYTFLLPILLFVVLEFQIVVFGLVLGIYTLAGLIAARLSQAFAPASRAASYITASTSVVGLGLLAVGTPAAAIAAVALLGIGGGFVRPATMMALAPALKPLGEDARRLVMRGLERDQGLIQAVLLVILGALLAGGFSLWLPFAALAAVVLLWNVAIRLAAARLAHTAGRG